MQFTKKYARIGTDDYQFRQGLGEDFYEKLSNNDRIMKQYLYLEISGSFGHKRGGYPDFIEGDARWGNNPDSDTEQNILLFPMDSSVDDAVHILWRDDRICNFFISQS